MTPKPKNLHLPLLTLAVSLISASPALAGPAQATHDYARQYATPSRDSAQYAQALASIQPTGVETQAAPFIPPPAKPKPRKPSARDLKRQYLNRIRTAPVGYEWAPILDLYTGGSYSVGHVNSLWQGAPRNRVVLQAAARYHLPYRLLLGVWGAESGWGKAWNHFGLIGPANGNLRHDAFYAARLFDRFYRQRYGRPAVR